MFGFVCLEPPRNADTKPLTPSTIRSVSKTSDNSRRLIDKLGTDPELALDRPDEVQHPNRSELYDFDRGNPQTQACCSSLRSRNDGLCSLADISQVNRGDFALQETETLQIFSL
jgi:hypothetical protein